MTSVPFTLYLEFTPYRGMERNPVRFPAAAHSGVVQGRRGGRFDTIRDMERISLAVYTNLNLVDILVVPYPGGSIHALSNRFVNIALATGISPQFGNVPPRLMLEGFVNFEDSDVSPPIDVDDAALAAQPNPANIVFSGNEVLSGYIGQQPWRGSAGLPVATVDQEVAILKSTIDTAIADIKDSTGRAPVVYRLLYKNITWGVGGHSFPIGE